MRLLILMLAASAVSIPLGLDLYIPIPESNPLTAEKIALGRRLFNDRRLSRDRTVACASCHVLARAFSDGRVVAIGVSGRTGRRNVPALLNRAYGRAFFWDGRSSTLEEQVLRPIEDPNEMDLPSDEAAARVGLDRMTMAHALASYVRSILAGDSRYDRFLSGDRSALTRDEAAGLAVFRGKGNCIACHIGPTLSDEQFHNTGVAWRSEGDSTAVQLLDEGRAAVTHREADRGAFKTPTLRDVARTAPYMHDGSLPSLEAVVDFYSEGGRANPFLDTEIRTRHFTLDEKRALVAFLRSLSGAIREGVSAIDATRVR
jgi:cytochrome c peroxidase